MCQFIANKPWPNQVLTTRHWTVGVIPNQAYLGRALITLLTHKASLGQLDQAEWQEFQDIIKKLEPAYEKAFGAKPLNIGCFMNLGYQADPPHPHVHWHIFPRYQQPYKVSGIAFDDARYGKFYDPEASNVVDGAVVTEIAKQLKAALQ